MFKGGAVLGHGGQACVFKPALPVPGLNTDHAVTKVMSEKSSATEHRVGVYMASFDKARKHGVYPVGPRVCGLTTDTLTANGANRGGKSRCSTMLDDIDRGKVMCAITYPEFLCTLEDPTVSLSPAQIVNALVGLWDSLQYIHSHGVVHGDIKAQNVAIVGSSGSPKSSPGPMRATDIRFVFADWGWSGILETDTKALLGKMRAHKSYVPDDFGGLGGIWSPLLWMPEIVAKSDSDMKFAQQLLRFNDVFSMVDMTRDLISRYETSGHVTAEQAKRAMDFLDDVYWHQERYITWPTREFVNIFKLALKGRSTGGRKATTKVARRVHVA